MINMSLRFEDLKKKHGRVMQTTDYLKILTKTHIWNLHEENFHL